MISSRSYNRLHAIKQTNPGVQISALVAAAVDQWIERGCIFTLKAPVESVKASARRVGASEKSEKSSDFLKDDDVI